MDYNIILTEHTLFEVIDKEKKAIERLKAFEPTDGYYLAFSGGKDSLCIYYLAIKAEVKFQAHYNHTTVDPPELIYFIRENFPDVIFSYPTETMWQLIVRKKIPPTRIARYCCSALKETNGKGKTVITGVRWAESARRKNTRGIVESWGKRSADKVMLLNDNDINRRFTESCIKSDKFIINPIIDWSDDDVWEFIRKYNHKYCCLYDKGEKRLGCIGCPLSGAKTMKKDFVTYPKYQQAYKLNHVHEQNGRMYVQLRELSHYIGIPTYLRRIQVLYLKPLT